MIERDRCLLLLSKSYVSRLKRIAFCGKIFENMKFSYYYFAIKYGLSILLLSFQSQGTHEKFCENIFSNQKRDISIFQLYFHFIFCDDKGFSRELNLIITRNSHRFTLEVFPFCTACMSKYNLIFMPRKDPMGIVA